MSAILDANGNPTASAPTVARIPTYEEMKRFLDVVTGLTLAFLQQHQADPLTVRSVGTIMSKLMLDGKQSQPEIENIISKAATAQLELIKLELLKASIDPAITEVPKATA